MTPTPPTWTWCPRVGPQSCRAWRIFSRRKQDGLLLGLRYSM